MTVRRARPGPAAPGAQPAPGTAEPGGRGDGAPAGLTSGSVRAGPPAGPEPTARNAVVPVDPRAVRVSLERAEGSEGEGPVEVAPPRAASAVAAGPGRGSSTLAGGAADAAASARGVRAESDRQPGHSAAGDLREGDRLPRIDGRPEQVELVARGHGRHALVLGLDAGSPVHVPVVLEPGDPGRGVGVVREVLVEGFRFDVRVESARLAALRERAVRARAAVGHGGPLHVRAIIPGRVATVSVTPGASVVAGEQLLVVEAMKMQNEIRSPRDGMVEQVHVTPGTSIEVGDLLVVIS